MPEKNVPRKKGEKLAEGKFFPKAEETQYGIAFLSSNR
jgi:hypothetical protein